MFSKERIIQTHHQHQNTILSWIHLCTLFDMQIDQGEQHRLFRASSFKCTSFSNQFCNLKFTKYSIETPIKKNYALKHLRYLFWTQKFVTALKFRINFLQLSNNKGMINNYFDRFSDGTKGYIFMFYVFTQFLTKKYDISLIYVNIEKLRVLHNSLILHTSGPMICRKDPTIYREELKRIKKNKKGIQKRLLCTYFG